MFQCPMCRQVANLDASVSMENLSSGLTRADEVNGQKEDEERSICEVQLDGLDNGEAEAEAEEDGEWVGSLNGSHAAGVNQPKDQNMSAEVEMTGSSSEERVFVE
jgi:hypothetical protein